jgi:hypothetical protein
VDCGPGTPLLAPRAARDENLYGLLFDPIDVYAAYRALGSSRAEVRTNALELLETMLPVGFRRVILPLVDEEMPAAERLTRASYVAATAAVGVLE